MLSHLICGTLLQHPLENNIPCISGFGHTFPFAWYIPHLYSLRSCPSSGKLPLWIPGDTVFLWPCPWVACLMLPHDMAVSLLASFFLPPPKRKLPEGRNYLCLFHLLPQRLAYNAYLDFQNPLSYQLPHYRSTRKEKFQVQVKMARGYFS